MKADLNIDDETLMAYADGELPATQAASIEQAMHSDTTLAARVAQHRALRTQLSNDFAAQLTEPVPARLLQILAAGSNSDAGANGKVADIAQARQRNLSLSNMRIRMVSALAATLIVGVALGVYGVNLTSDNLISADHDGLVAQGKLAKTLTLQLAASNSAAQNIQIGISFRNHADEFCRSFSIASERSLAGLACRAQNDWRVQLLTEDAAQPSDEFRQASSTTPAAVLKLIEQQIQGEPLTAMDEAAAQHAGWR